MVESQFSKLVMRVRLTPPAPIIMIFLVKIVDQEVGVHDKINHAIEQANGLADGNTTHIAITVSKKIATLIAFKCGPLAPSIWTVIQKKRQVVVSTPCTQGKGDGLV